MSDDGVDAGDSFGPREWIADLSYKEIHAAVIGASLAFLAAVGSNVEILTVLLAILLWALGVRASPRRSTASGDRKPKDTDDDDKRTGLSSGMVRKLLVQIRQETHYYIGGVVVGDRIGWIAHKRLYDVPPDHYQEINQIIETLLLGGIA